MMVELIDSEVINGITVWLSSNQRLGASFSAQMIDVETTEPSEIERSLESILSNVSDELFIRFQLNSEFDTQEYQGFARADAINDIPKFRHSLIMHFEVRLLIAFGKLFGGPKKQRSGLFGQAHEELLAKIPLEEFSEKLGLGLQSLSINEVKSLFPERGFPVAYRPFGVERGNEYVGVFKMLSPGNYTQTFETFAMIREQLPVPFQVVLQMKKVNRAFAETWLSQIARREANSTKIADAHKAHQSEEKLANLQLKNESLFSYELHVLLPRSNEEELRHHAKKVLLELSKMGDFLFESIGAVPAYNSTLPGASFHFKGFFESLLEEKSNIPCIIPMFKRGAKAKVEFLPDAMPFHRSDMSIDSISVFDPTYDNYNMSVIGQAGRGKSVFVTQVIKTLAFEPTTRIIVIDVMGSHTRTVTALGGEINQIDITKSSGINILSALKFDSSEYSIKTVATLLSELMLEPEEKRMSEAEMFDLERALGAYAKSSVSEYTIDAFLQLLPEDFPRKKLLSRFGREGMYKHLFSGAASVKPAKLRYYNFGGIDLASNVAVVRAIVAGIMADFQHQLLTKNRGEKIAFICDETPFFVEQCFRSYKLLSKNIRKMYGSLILTVQKSTDLIVDGDESLLNGANSHVIFSGDPNKEDFKRRFQTTDRQTDTVFAVRSEKGKFSQFVFKDNKKFLVGHLVLTPQEYQESTTEGPDVARIDKFKRIFPTAPDEAIIEFLSRLGRKAIIPDLFAQKATKELTP